MARTFDPFQRATLPPALRRVLADRFGLPAAARWRVLTGGRSARCFLLHHGSGNWVLKIARAQSGGLLFPIRPDIEARIMERLAPFALAAEPAAFFSFGRESCLLYRYVPGATAPAPTQAFARRLRQMHETSTASLGFLPKRRDLSIPLVQAARRYLAKDVATRELTGLVDLAVAAQGTGRSALQHGDPVGSNVIESEGGPVLIDWQCAHVGDPSRDLALALSPAMQVIHGATPLDAAARAAFLAAYGAPGVTRHLAARAAAYHAQMIGHCLWRLARNDLSYRPALRAEMNALADLSER